MNFDKNHSHKKLNHALASFLQFKKTIDSVKTKRNFGK